MDKKTFDFNSEILKLFNDKKFDVDVRVAGASDTLFCVANENAGKKFDIVFVESDYLKFSKIIIGALKRACAEFSIFLIEDKDFTHSKNKSFFNFNGDIVVVVGNMDLISITSHYASIQNKEIYAVLTEPCAEYLLLNKARIFANGIYTSVDIKPIKSLIYDIDILIKASNEAYQESFINVISKLVTLIDYKFRVLITGKEFDLKSYQRIKNAISLVAGINAYENRKEVLIYAEAVMATERKLSEVIDDGAVELYCDALGLFSSKAPKRERLFMAMRSILELYEMLFVSNLSGLISVADYNADVTFLEKSTGKSGSYFRKNLLIPSPRRLDIINKILLKTKDGFLKEIESVLFVMKAIEKVYKSFGGKVDNENKLPLSAKREGLRASTYLSNKITLLTHMRDMGVLRCVDEK